MKRDDLLIISAAVHFEGVDGIYAYTPYARELKAWGDIFPHIVIAAPGGTGPIPDDCSRIDLPRVRLEPFSTSGGDRFGEKMRQLLVVPSMAWRIAVLCRRAGAVHVRCPGNLGLLGAAIAPLFSRRLIAKYAGQWTGYDGEALTTKLQRRLLASRWWRGPVTVYGEWPNQPVHVIPFFTSVMDHGNMRRAEIAATRRLPHDPFRVLFVGRLSAQKRAASAVDAIKVLRDRGLNLELRVIGDGPELERIKKQIEEVDVARFVHAEGARPFAEVLDAYEWADALVLASDTEGWPKAIAEAMTFGVPCVGSDIGLIRQMLANDRGIPVSPGNSSEIAAALESLMSDPARYQSMSKRAADWGRAYSLDGLRMALVGLLEKWWSPTAVSARTKTAVMQIVDTLQPGGAESVAVDLANSISTASFVSHLCTTRSSGPLGQRIQPHVRRLELGRRYSLDLGAVRRLRRYVRDERIDVVHAHGMAVMIAAAAVAGTSTRLIWHIHTPVGAGTAPDVGAMTWIAYWVAARVVDQILTASSAAAIWAERSFHVAASAMPNFVQGPPQLGGRRPARQAVIVACSAHLRPQKDHSTLLRAAQQVLKTHPLTLFRFFGASSDASYAGRLEDEARALGIETSVRFEGYLPDIQSALRSADIGVLSSKAEGFPLALIDYGLANLGVVATKVGDCPAILDDGSAGILVDPGNSNQLAEALIKLIENPDLRQTFADALTERVTSVYDRNRGIAKFEAIYLETTAH